MKRLLASMNTLHIIVLIMLAMICVALIVHHVDNSTTAMRHTHASRATANTPVSR
jgi:predicted tellurium resistance membrane protein TerC